jgi:hypothetical protein
MQDAPSPQASPTPVPPQDVDALFPEKSGDTQDVDSLFPASVEADRRAKAQGISSSPVQDLIFGDTSNPNSIAHVLDGFGVGARQSWGQDAIGLTEEHKDELKKAGIKVDNWLNSQGELVKAANVALIRPYATQFYKNLLLGGSVLDVANRSIAAGLGGVAGAVSAISPWAGEKLETGIAAATDPALAATLGPFGGPVSVLSAPLRLVAAARANRIIGRGEAGWAGTAPIDEVKPKAAVSLETSPTPITGTAEQPSPMATPPVAASPIPENITPDIHTAARQAAPDVFARYDTLKQQQDGLQKWLAEREAQGQSEPGVKAYLDGVNKELDELSPQIKTAYQQAAETTNAATVPPPVSQSWGMFPPPEVTGTPAKIDATHTVISGANSTADGTVVVDHNIPEFSPTLKDKDGNPANLHKYLAVHEAVEADAMKRGMSYDDAHTKVATPAERAAVEADGVDWNAYTKEMDGYLDHIEHEANTNPPPGQMHIDPEDAIGHHKSENKPSVPADQVIKPIEAQRNFIVNDVKRQLTAAGRPEAEAQAAGQLVAARYEARAARLGGARGSAEELYKAEGAQIRGPRGTAAPTPTGAPAITPTPAAEAVPEEELATIGHRAPRGPRAVPEQLWSLLQFIADRGGIKVDDKNIGDVRTIFGKDQKWIPGFGPLIRKDGMTLDHARELAVEAGYIQDLGQSGVSAGEATSNIDTLLQAMDREERGTKVYRQGVEPAEARERVPDAAELEQHQAAQAELDTRIADYLKEVGMKPSEIEPSIAARMRELMDRQRLEPDIGHERAVMEADDHAVETENAPERAEYIPGWDLPDDTGAAQGARGATAQGEEAAPGARARTDRDGDREKAWTKFYQRKRDLIAEREAEGQQQIPGAERISDAERAQRAADHPLKPKAEQKPMDVGLSGDEKDQQELFQQARGGIVLNPNAVPGHDYIGMENVRPLMRLTAEANASTFFHESGHQYLAELVRDAAHEAAPADLKADAQTVMDWLGLKGPQDLALGSDASRAAKIKATKAHEKFARGFEQYLREGIAPSQQLAGVFAKFKNWLMNIYQTIKGLGAPISDDIRGVFDRMLAEEPQRTVIAPEIVKRPDLQDIHESDAVLTEPHEAERAGDRVQAEDARARAELPKDIADEHRGSAEKIGTSPTEPIPLGENRGGPDTIGAGGAGSAELGTEPQGGGHIVPQGAGLRTREGGAGTIEPLSIGPHVPLDALPAAKMDKVGNIRLENLNTPADVNNAIRDLYRANRDQLDAATRGVVSDQTVMDLADAMGTDPRVVANNMERLRQMSVEDGVPLAARIWLMRDMFTKLSAEVANLAKGDDVAAFASARQRFLMAFETLSGVTAEMGRGMRAFRNMKTQMASAIEMANILKDDPKTLFQLKQQMALARAAETPAQSAAEIQRANRTPWQRVRAGVISYVINNLISGPITHVMYSVGNDILQLFKALPETGAASLAGRVLVATGKISEEDRIRMGEAGPRLYGMVYGARDGLSASYSALKTGVSVMKGDPSGIDLFSNEIAYRPQEIPGTVGYVLETPSRSVAAIHTMHYGMNYESEIAALGYRDAIKRGFEPGTDEFNGQVAEFRMNPPRDAMDIAHTVALEQVLMRRPPYGGLQNWIQNLTNKYLLAKLVAPFVQIGGNILRGGFIERTPLGLMDQTVRDNLLGRNGAFKQQEQYGRMMVGSTLAVSTIGLAAQGIITGGGPSDPKQREVMEMTGWKPYSIKVGGEYIPYRKYLSVYGPLVAGAADMYEVGHAMSDKGLAQGATALSFGFAEVVADETWMRGITSLIDAARHWDRDGAKYMRNLSTEFIPFSIGARQIASLADPTWRSVRSEMDALRAHIPGLSQSLFPVRDLWGQPMRGGSMMSWSPAINDPATIALQKAEYYPARPERKIRGIELTDQQYDDFTRIAGRDAKMRINAMISNPGFDLIPQQIRQEQLKSAMEGGREMARTVILMQYPEIMKQALDAKHAILQKATVH